MKKAEQQKEDVRTKVAVETAADDARKIELRKKASDPQIQAVGAVHYPRLLAAQHHHARQKPLSFTKLSCGALEPTIKGGIYPWPPLVHLSRQGKAPDQSARIHPPPDAIERIKEAPATPHRSLACPRGDEAFGALSL